jgi:predicted HicB family RNase H-like nuclease
MMNLMDINGFRAVIKYDPEIEMFRGEFIGLNGSADFYADNIKKLKKEGTILLKSFLKLVRNVTLNPKRNILGNLMCAYHPLFMPISPVLLRQRVKA